MIKCLVFLFRRPAGEPLGADGREACGTATGASLRAFSPGNMGPRGRLRPAVRYGEGEGDGGGREHWNAASGNGGVG